MKSRISLIAFVVAATAVSAFAAGGWRLTNAKVPFAFRAGQIMMPAGNYEVESPWNTAAPIVTLRNTDTGDMTAFVVPLRVGPASGQAPSLAYLEFLCAGSDCAFYRVFPGGAGNGYAVSKPKVGAQMGSNSSPGEIRVARVIVPMRSSQ